MPQILGKFGVRESDYNMFEISTKFEFKVVIQLIFV